MPNIAFAGCYGIHIVCAVVDGQMERVHAGTTVRIGVCIRVSAALGISLPMPSVVLARVCRNYIVGTIIYGQMQEDDTVAANPI